MDNSSLKNKTMSGLVWVFLERIGTQLVGFIVSMVLARLLLPEDYGIIAIVTIFVNILNVLLTGSFSQALIQKKAADSVDFSSVLLFNTGFSVVLYGILFLCAPFIASFYEYEMLASVIRVMGIQVLISAYSSVQRAYVTRNMKFRTLFISNTTGIIISAAVGLTMAYNNYGVWALVAQHLSSSLIGCLVLAAVTRWKLKLQFSLDRLKSLLSFGWKVLVSSLIDTIYEDLRGLIIGKRYTKSDLAFYNRGKQFPYLIVNNVNSSLAGVLFPAMSSKQDNPETVKTITRRAMNISSYIMMPLMFGMAIVAKPMVLLLLTEKWLPCVPFVQILCFNAALMPIQTANGQAILAMGRSDITVKLSIIKKAFGLTMIIVSSQISVIAMAYAGMLTGIFASVVNAYPNKKLLKYSYIEQLKDILPYILMSAAMAGVVYWAIYLPIPTILQLLIQITVGGAIYIGLSILFKIESFTYLKDTLLGLISKRKKTT